MAKTRTFVAIEVSPEVRDAAASLADELRSAAPGFRWVAEENLHYTLQFLGDITDQEIADVCARVTQVAANAEPFSLQAFGAGAFPSLDRPRTIWIGAGRGADELTALQQRIEAALDGLGFRGENRRFVPHLTIGKAGRSGRPAVELAPQIEALADFEVGVTAVDQVTVFASELLPGGPEYHVLARCPLSP